MILALIRAFPPRSVHDEIPASFFPALLKYLHQFAHLPLDYPKLAVAAYLFHIILKTEHFL